MSTKDPVLVKFEGAKHTDDGKFILLKFGPHAPGYIVEHVLAMPVQEVPGLASVTLSVLGVAFQNQVPNQKLALDVEWWEIAEDKETEQVIFSFRMPGNGEISFHIHKDQAAHMRDVLVSMLGPSPDIPTNITKN